MMPLPKMSRKQRSGYELFALSDEPLTVNEVPQYNSLDQCIDDTLHRNGEMFSLVDLVKGHSN